MKYWITSLLFVVALAWPSAARAQESELVSEIVARVNNDIVTSADYKAALRDFKEELKRQMAGKSEAEIEAEFNKLKPTVLDLIIENLLLEQKAKELGADVEPDVNQQMLQMAQENGFKTLSEFEAALKQQGFDPENMRTSLRQRLQQQYVMNREVLSNIFSNLTDKDRQAFYEKNKKYFTTEGEATISEIFLPLDNQTADEVTQRAKRIVAEIRAGKNFVEAVQQYSAPTRASRALNGKLGTFKLKEGELKPDLLAAIKDLKTGDVTEPIRQQDGFQIIHVDEKKDPAVLPFSNPDVQRAVNQGATMERADEARKKYVKKLRDEAFVDINKAYATPEAKPAETKGGTQ
ncbi:MAG: SurA N-terminal domain-containing protein [Acidobacteria bacterium]|nr:SurA N-terminal domain-containing protein [Acidobacteriota bacterium]